MTCIILHFGSYRRIPKVFCLFVRGVGVISLGLRIERKTKRRFVLNSFRVEDTQTFLRLSSKESFVCLCIEPFQLPSCYLSRVELSQSEIVHLSTVSLILHDCSIISIPCDLRYLTPLEKLYLI